ncbi:50S ribosomal protein L20, partial [Aphelenchoides avenae]
NQLDQAHILLDNTVLAQLALYEPLTFKSICLLAKQMAEEEGRPLVRDPEQDNVETDPTLFGEPYPRGRVYAKGPTEMHQRKPRQLKATPKRSRTFGTKAPISFKQLRDCVDDLKQQGHSGPLQCPLCVTKKNGFKTLVRHLYEHLDTKEHYFYKCPFDECDYRAVRLEHVKAHAANRAHDAAWTDDMNSRCVVQGNLDCYTAMCR